MNLFFCYGFDNQMTGNALNNLLDGRAGNDWLDGGAGNDTLIGGLGDDTFVVDSTGDQIVENAGEGTDTVRSSASWTLGTTVERLVLTGTDNINGTSSTADMGDIRGNSGNNVLTVQNTGLQAWVLYGGPGDDTYVVQSGMTFCVENPGEGIDTIQTSGGYDLSTQAHDIENVTLTGTASTSATGNEVDNALIGNSGVNRLTGKGGNDYLDGGAGADTMLGGLGNDTYLVDNASDVVTEYAGEGTDAVRSSITYTLPDNVEQLTLTGTSNLKGTGNALDNVIVGNSGRNTLTGGAGNDWLDGGTNSDGLVGGTGDDTYVVDATGDSITENAGEGADTVLSSVTWTLGTNLENLTLIGAIAVNGTGNTLNNALAGNSANNVLTGGAGDDSLDGGAGADTLVGGTGNDTYSLDRGYGPDIIQENDTTAGNTDIAQFMSGIATDQVWFQHSGSNLVVSIIGTSDSSRRRRQTSQPSISGIIISSKTRSGCVR